MVRWKSIEKCLLKDPVPVTAAPGEARASVMILLAEHPERKREEIILTKRTMHVETHKGQISFPGGFEQSGDPDLLATALREAHEEIGLDSRTVHLLGGMEPERTPGKVWVHPWVARIPFPSRFELNPREVDRLLFLPLEKLLEEGLSDVSVPVGPVSIPSIGIEVDGDLVWGITARFLNQLRTRTISAYDLRAV